MAEKRNPHENEESGLTNDNVRGIADDEEFEDVEEGDDEADEDETADDIE
jgi:hypothetical protein